MELNPGLHDLIDRERRTDALRNAERWRQLKALKEPRDSPGWMQRLALRLRGSLSVQPRGPVAAQRSERPQTASGPTA